MKLLGVADTIQTIMILRKAAATCATVALLIDKMCFIVPNRVSQSLSHSETCHAIMVIPRLEHSDDPSR